MKIKEMFEKFNLVYSYEIFPPNIKSPIEKVYSAIEELAELNPDYISVTYGAGGSTQDNRTSILSSKIKNTHQVESLAHLTCVNATKDFIDCILEELKKNSIENILALRGDIPKSGLKPTDFANSQKLIQYVKDQGFGVAAAAYPEGHIETKIKDKDIDILKFKEEAGADYFITQLFFDNNRFYNFLNKVEQKGITAPIQVGIMPVINKAQIERTVAITGTVLPEKFIKIINRYEHDKIALRDAGIAYATEQIVDLISSGVRGVHLYTMNNPYIAKTITSNISSLIKSVNYEK